MRHVPALALSLALSLAAASTAAQPAPTCQPHEAAVFAPGCDGPAQTICHGGASLPAGSEWCGCDGQTHQSWSMAPPAGVRYRAQGACAVTASFEVTDERTERAARTGRAVVFAKVGGGVQEVTRTAGPCREAPAGTGELARLVCGPRRVTLVMQRQGDAVLVLVEDREFARVPTPGGQRVTGAALRRF